MIFDMTMICIIMPHRRVNKQFHHAKRAAEQSAKSRPVLFGRLDAVLPAIPFELLLLLILLLQSCSNPQRLRSSFP